MALRFLSQYKSIKNFDSVDLDDFSIFTGKNGSGKTHLLEAIKKGNVEFDSFKPEEIVYFNLATFKTFDTKFKDNQDMKSSHAREYSDFKHNVNQYKSRYPILTELESNKINKILIDKNKTLYDIQAKEINNDELWGKIAEYQHFLGVEFANRRFSNITISVIKKSKNFIHDISEYEFKTSYVLILSNDNPILTELGILFHNYQMRLYDERNNIYSTANENATKKEMDKIVQDKCNARFGGVPPWEAVNKILESYSDMNHKLVEPQKTKIPERGVNLTSFPVIIKEKSTNAEINPDDLSSGEVVLFALALSVFKRNISSSLPKVLLLDEIDATLHPSMIKNLLRVVDKIFVQNKIKVILATHSPTTIALCKDMQIFVINNKKKSKLIQLQRPEDALDKLTDGFVTIEEGLGLLKTISEKEITIITEGYNTEYIQKAVDLFAFDNKDKIYILRGVEKKTGDKILKTLFYFFNMVKHDKKVMFVFDPDCKECNGMLKENDNTYFYVLLKHEGNTMSKGGIETMFSDKFFDSNDVCTIKNGEQKIKRTICQNRKKSFMKKMIKDANEENFENFKPLVSYIEKKLSNESQNNNLDK